MLIITKPSDLNISFTTRTGSKTVRFFNNESLFSFAADALRYGDATCSSMDVSAPNTEDLEDAILSADNDIVTLRIGTEVFKLGTIREFAAALLAAYEKHPEEWVLSTFHIYDNDPAAQAAFVQQDSSQALLKHFDKYVNHLRKVVYVSNETYD